MWGSRSGVAQAHAHSSRVEPPSPCSLPALQGFEPESQVWLEAAHVGQVQGLSWRLKFVRLVSPLSALMSVIELVWSKRLVRLVSPLSALMSVRLGLLRRLSRVRLVRFWIPVRLSNGSLVLRGGGG